MGVFTKSRRVLRCGEDALRVRLLSKIWVFFLVGARGEQDHEGEGSCLPQRGGFQSRASSELSSKSLLPGNVPRQKFPATSLFPSPLGHSPHPRRTL